MSRLIQSFLKMIYNKDVDASCTLQTSRRGVWRDCAVKIYDGIDIKMLLTCLFRRCVDYTCIQNCAFVFKLCKDQ